MKRVFPLLLSIVLLLVLLFGATSCTKKKGAEGDIFYQVAFNTASLPYEATPPAVVTVKAGESVSAPTLDAGPSAGYVVIWVRDLSERSAYDFSTPVQASFVLYAVEVPRTYTVTYLLERGKNSKDNPTTFTKDTETITLASPTKVFGYVFDRWAYFDDPDSRVSAIEKGTERDLVLRAVYLPAEYIVTYFPTSDPQPNPTTYTFGTTLSLESPSKEGYRFLGYTIAGDPADTPVTEITAEFILAHKDVLFKVNGTIALQANWEELK